MVERLELLIVPASLPQENQQLNGKALSRYLTFRNRFSNSD